MSIAPIIITGGGQRLGFDIAKELKAQGHHVIITYRAYKSGVKTLEEKGITCIQVDFSLEDQTNAFIERIQTEFSSIKGLIHNASSWLPEEPNHTPRDTLKENFAIHVDTPYCLNLAFEPLLLNYAKSNQSMADVIHMTDYVVERGSKKHIAYAASKAALANMTLSFAAKWAPFVKVNNIAPALLMFNEHDTDAYKAKASKKSLLSAAPGAHEATHTVMYIFNSDYITGRTLALDGGRQLMGG